MALPIMSSETIKPSSPTPSHLKCYYLSFLDHLSCSNYIPLVLLYPNNTNTSENPQNTADEISRRLKHSLSQTLTEYYPFAGRLLSTTHVHCNDEGVEFQETRIGSNLVDILEKPGSADLELLFPEGMVWGNVENDDPLVVVRLTHFVCGGISVAVCMSHKVADAASLCNFLTYWAALTSQSGKQVSPHFVTKPLNDNLLNICKAIPKFKRPQKFWVTRRFLFQNAKIAELKAVVGGGQNRSRIEVVSALIYKCAIKAANISSGSFKPSAFIHPANLRSKMVPVPLPETSVGNICFPLTVPTISTESGSTLEALADQIKKSKMQVEGVRDLDGIGDLMLNVFQFWHSNFYTCSSLCNFPLYELDFGFGKPVRAALAGTLLHNIFMLTDTPNGDGIEALVSLVEKDMTIFQHDNELLAFGSYLI